MGKGANIAGHNCAGLQEGHDGTARDGEVFGDAAPSEEVHDEVGPAHMVEERDELLVGVRNVVVPARPSARMHLSCFPQVSVSGALSRRRRVLPIEAILHQKDVFLLVYP